VRHNIAVYPRRLRFDAVRSENRRPADRLQWLLRRVAGGVSYQDLGRNPPVDMVQLADGVYSAEGRRITRS
jgi:hypothetical protein